MDSIKSNFINKFLRLESAGGIVLIFSAALAIIIANSPLNRFYELLLTTPVEIRIGALEIAKPLLLWINDGLMAVFFLMVGLELKREILEGELSDTRKILLPAIGAVGGMLVPAMVYLYFNGDDPVAAQGWAIPAATDIAFALGILSLLGSRVPVALKVFLTSLAIFDDIGAIVIIALFYTSKVSVSALLFAAACIPFLWLLNRANVTHKSPYVLIGVLMWVATLKSGVHATLAGVIIALFIPMRSKSEPDISPLKTMEHDLHQVVAFFILPVFAFANAGLNLTGISFEQLTHPVPVGITLGLFVGKIIGIFGLCWLAIRLKLVELPKSMRLPHLLGTSALCGVGFTMSLFIGSLAFEETGVNLLFDERLGIIAGSIISGITGYLILKFSLNDTSTN
ncbi:Na+/H+ antiporter NhaA [Kangiella sp. TOML190]|uniref:Na+/H+ antiporter NhaA n=1 Tax=Kangiella sp. TOML190 TaxID=2931351 RepID=UPI00203D3D70|nr:Na+/H+ antiporter NhaA [Kangiella sp. TOML190]